jgi:putative Mn2+ efflux pump MntP
MGVETVSIIYLFFIAILNSIDNMGVGVAYSIAGKKVPIFKNILISLMAFAVSFVSSLSGGIISHFLNERICTIISMLLLVSMGLRMIYQSFSEKDDNDLEKYNVISNKEAITVGIILALDDVGSSVSSGLIGYGPFMVSMPYFVISFIIFSLANYGAGFVSKLNIGKKATIVSGILMILMGALQFFD